MARQPRYNLPDVPQHVIQRGNNRQPVFFAEDDYQIYLDKLNAASVRHCCDIHAYVLMTNHVHLLMTPRKADGISKVLQSLGRTYVAYINRAYQRSGTLWEGRYRASLIDSERYLLACQRYIELNPVRAGMVMHPGEYRWSSFRANAHGETDLLTSKHEQYQTLGTNPQDRQRAYRELFQEQLDSVQLRSIRDALNQSQVLGSERFKNEIEQHLQRRIRPGKPGRPKKRHGDDESTSDQQEMSV